MLSYKQLLNLKIIAIQNSIDESIDSYVEKAYRHFSKTYNTPLFEAKEKLTPHEVVLILMEDELEDFKVEELQDMLNELRPPVQLGAPEEMINSENVADDELWIAQQNKLLKEQDEKEKNKQNEEIVKKTHEAIEKLTSALSKTMGPKE